MGRLVSSHVPHHVPHVVPEGVTHADPCCVCKWELPLSPALYPDRPIYLLIKKKKYLKTLERVARWMAWGMGGWGVWVITDARGVRKGDMVGCIVGDMVGDMK